VAAINAETLDTTATQAAGPHPASAFAASRSLVSVDALIKPRQRAVRNVTPHRLREWTFEGPSALKPLRPGATNPEFWL
jgi:hypothetical protein